MYLNGIVRFLQKKALIILTLLYILTLVILNTYGFFSAPSKNDIYHQAPYKKAEVEGIVLSPPEHRKDKTLFILKSLSLNGKTTDGKILTSCDPQAADVKPGDVLRLTGNLKKPHINTNPGGFDYARYLSYKKIYTLLYVRKLKILSHQKLPFYKSLALNIRKSMLNTINENLPPMEATLLSQMLVGVRSGLSDEEKSKFVDAGVMHVLVVSGLHVGYCVAILWGLFKLMGFPYRRSALLTLPFIPLYALITGANPPVVRASIMAVFIIASLSIARESNIYHSLSLAALTILAFNPRSLFTASFILSFTATLGIVYLYPFISAPFRKLPAWARWPANLFAVSVAAQLSVNPLIALYFNRISLVGLISNIFVVPLVGLIIAAGIVLYIVNLILPGITIILLIVSKINYFLLHTLHGIVSFLADIPGSAIRVSTPSLLFMVVYYVFLWGVFQIKRIPKMIHILVTFAFFIGIAAFAARLSHRNQLDITFLNVGYGDAVHVKFPGGENWLIDSGGSFNPKYEVGERVVCPYLWSKNVSKLDKVILTSPQFPRYGGMHAVLENFPVDEIIFNPEVSFDDEFIELMELIEDKKIPFREVWAGDRFKVGNASITVLSPEILSTRKDENCLVLSLDFHEHRVLLTSSMAKKAEQRLLESQSQKYLKATVLHLPKYGQKKLSTEFIAATRPDYVIVSTSKNSPEGAKPFTPSKVFSTKTNGAVTVTMNKNGIDILGFLR